MIFASGASDRTSGRTACADINNPALDPVDLLTLYMYAQIISYVYAWIMHVKLKTNVKMLLDFDWETLVIFNDASVRWAYTRLWVS